MSGHNVISALESQVNANGLHPVVDQEPDPR